ncbi:MAG: serine/threonine-protein kinase [Thermoanaerobaculia bacterium]
MADFSAGASVGRFRLERPLGQGAMGAVYLATDPEIERPVAIKIIRRDPTADPEQQAAVEARFLKEAKIAGRLQHPNIVTIYDVGRDAETLFIAMEYVEGRPLARFLRPGVALSDAQRLLVLRQTAEALSHAHERSVVHRDVKPGNILIRADGVAKVSDFGIGKLLLPGSSELTQAGQLVGSPSYMSPEQIRGETLDGRSDRFSLGIVAYELFTGSRPFPGDTISSLMYQILHTAPRDPLELRPDLSPAAADLLRKALAKKREDRYFDAREFVRDLDRLGPDAGDAAATSVVPFPAADSGSGDRLLSRSSGVRASAVPGAAASTPTVIVQKRGGALLFGTAALILAAAAFLFVVLQPLRTRYLAGEFSLRARKPDPGAAKSAPASGPSSSPKDLVPAAGSETAPPAPVPASASPAIGEPRPNPGAAATKADSRAARSTKKAPEEAAAAPVPPAAPAADPSAPADRVYRTRRGMKFQISPDQARLFVDGIYVGVADDWDDHGGGKVFPFSAGTHAVHAKLPGYRELRLQIIADPSAPNDTESAGDDMTRLTKEAYQRVPKVDYATTSSVLFSPKFGVADVSVDGKPAGTAAQYSAASPLRLFGPMVHEIVIRRVARPDKTFRVLSASTAGKDSVEIKE